MVYPFVMYSAHCSSEKFPYITDKGIKDRLTKETGRDRVRRMYSTNEFGYSPEMYYVIKCGTYTTVCAAFFGGVKSMMMAKDDFFRKNMASTYESEHLARRSLTDTMSLAAVRGGFKVGFQYGAFSTLYLLSTMTVANYRNKMSVWEHVGSAAVLGGFSRFKYGIKGMLIAGGLGGFLGLLAGGVITSVMHFAGVTMEDLRCMQHEEYYTQLKTKKKSDAEQ